MRLKPARRSWVSICLSTLSGLRLPGDDAQADMYLWMVDRLAQAGYLQYEISNFARPGFFTKYSRRYSHSSTPRVVRRRSMRYSPPRSRPA